jgi:inward rectifier potassium channel
MSDNRSDESPAKVTPVFQPAKVRRVGIKSGAVNDAYHLLLNASWARFFLIITSGYLIANAFFAALYVLDRNSLDGGTGYLDAFFFSVQTMATIGYGKMTPRTTFANALVTIEALVGLLAMAMATGLMFAKFSRPTARVVFSNVCVIHVRDGVRTLSFRLANERNSQILQAQVQVVAIADERTIEGDSLRRLRDLQLTRSHSPAMVLSWTVFHPITADSPLFKRSLDELRAVNLSIAVTVTGLDDALSATVHTQKFYTVADIVEDERFVDMLLVEPDGSRTLDIGRIHDTQPALAAQAS